MQNHIYDVEIYRPMQIMMIIVIIFYRRVVSAECNKGAVICSQNNEIE